MILDETSVIVAKETMEIWLERGWEGKGLKRRGGLTVCHDEGGGV
jgi:hypothetical protein